MKIREITGALEQFAPLSLQDSYDNAGLQIGLTVDAESSGVLLCLDVTEEVIDEAKEKGCNLIVSHHPLMFRPPKRIAGEDIVQRCIIRAIQQGVNIYASHTNLDNAPGGVNYKIAEKLGLQDIVPLCPKPEMEGAGSGVRGILQDSMDKEDFIVLVKETFDAGSVRFNSWTGETVRKVAVCGGAGAFLISDAINQQADAFITGEIGYHRFFGYDNFIQLMEIGHYESEQYTIELLESIIRNVCPELKIEKTEIETNPINYL
jgi:dinuclear metal center YbgI/SA1388 family protein